MGRGRLSSVNVSLPFAGVDTTWQVSTAVRDAAWRMLVELVTRTAVSALGDDDGTDAAALASLHSLFDTTRQILKDQGFDTGRDGADGSLGFAVTAVRILNEVVRPFTSYWHPIVDAHTTARPAGVSAMVWEREGFAPGAGTPYDHRAFRSDLARVRDQLRQYVFVLARAAGTPEFGAAVLSDVARLAEAGRPVRAEVQSKVTVPGPTAPRRHMVRWFDPIEGLASLIATRRGKDDRDVRAPTVDDASEAVQSTRPTAPPAEHCSFDFAADTGDAFDPACQVAWTLGRRALTTTAKDGRPLTLPRGSLLILGGDEVYPYASATRYRNQLVSPFEHGFEEGDVADEAQRVLAIPGNHDWYGGLEPFRDLFCSGKGFAGRATGQATSWWATRLTSQWWCWGIDTYLDGSINSEQRAYFKEQAASHLRAGDQVIVCTPVPLWRLREAHPEHLVVLESFLDETIAAAGAFARVFLSGDFHVFACYTRTRAGGVPEVHVTSGGAGAFLHPTHNLATVVPQTPIDDPADAAVDPAPFTDGQFWPDPSSSHSQDKGRLWQALRDRQSPSLALALGVLHGLFGLSSGCTVRRRDVGAGWSGALRLLARMTISGSGSWATAIAGVLCLAAGIGVARPNTAERLVKRAATRIGVVHGLLQWSTFVVVATAVHWVVWQASGDRWGRNAAWWVGIVGGTIGGVASVVLLLGVLHWANARYRVNDNEAFSSRHFAGGKHFLRCNIDELGHLHVRLVAIDKVRRGWAVAIRAGGPLPPHAGASGSATVAALQWETTVRPFVAPVRFGPMQSRRVAVSISSPDVGAEPSLDGMFALLASTLFDAGFDVAYGGDLRSTGFTQRLVALSRAAGDVRASRIHNYLVSGRYDARLARSVQGVNLVKVAIDGAGVLPQLVAAAEFSEMRRTMTEEALARVVVGGRVAGASGFAPGIVEEAFMAVQARRPLFVCGGFGGAAHLLAQAVEGKLSTDDRAALVEDPGYRSRSQLDPTRPTASVMLDVFGPGLDLHDGLEPDERAELFTSTDRSRVVALVLTGLRRVVAASFDSD